MKKLATLTAACSLLIVLVVVAAQDTTDEPPDLVIPVEQLGTEEELLEQLAEHYGGDVLIEITPELQRLLDAVEADDGSLSEVLTDIVGQEVRLESEQEHFHGTHKVWERRSTDEILARMDPKHVEALADHRHLLDDEQQLFLEMDNWEGVQHDAAMEFFSKLTKPDPIESMLPPELVEERRVVQERGWYDVPGPARGSQLLLHMEMMDEQDRAELRREAQEFHGYREDSFSQQPSGGYLFDLPGYERVEVFADNEFDAVLHIEKSAVNEVYFDDANLTVAGRDASVTVGKHGDGTWVTSVTAFDGRHLYQVVLEKQVEGAEREAFIQAATRMIEEDQSLPR